MHITAGNRHCWIDDAQFFCVGPLLSTSEANDRRNTNEAVEPSILVASCRVKVGESMIFEEGTD